jgi:hypothetical protein
MTPPSPHPSRARRWLARAIAVFGLTTLMADGGLRQDELDCEEAASYLQSCCPDFTITFSCTYSSGCDDTVVPDLSIDQSQCILAESCEEIVSSGVCTRLPGSPIPAGTPTGPTPVCL